MFDGPDAAARRALLALLPVDRPPTLRGDDPDAWRAMIEAGPAGLQPYVALRAERSGVPLHPEVRTFVDRTRRAAALSFLRRRALAREAVGACRDAGIPVLVLKGMAVAHLVYPDPAVRLMSDLDLWVEERALHPAARALTARGLTEPARLRDPASRGDMFVFQPVDAPLLLELHTRPRSLEGVPDRDFAAVCRRSVPFSLGDVEARSLGPADLLLHLALHTARNHGFSSGLVHLVDVALVIERWRDDWDWDTMVAAWRRDRVLPWVLLVVVLARDLLGAPAPASLEEMGGVPAGWEEMVRLAGEQVWHAPAPELGLAARRWVGAGSASERLRYLWWRGVRYYWESGEPAQPRSLGRRLRDAGARLAFDARVKVPRYLRHWRAGHFTRGALGDKASDARDRRRLEQLAIAGGALPPVQSVEHEERAPDDRT